jgi:CRISPR-associated endonuclease/helicase Cas3
VEWLAHSAKRGFPAQTYGDHVGRAVAEAKRMADEASDGLPQAKPFVEMVALATEFHDMGKLDDDNQQVLAAPTGEPLPRDHVDAGVKHLFGLGTHAASFAGMLAYSHHRGLPDTSRQKVRDSKAWRGDEEGERFNPDDVIARTKACLSAYFDRHQKALARAATQAAPTPFTPVPFDLRIGLSCVVDADHSDTARHYGEALIAPPVLRADERIARLDAYVAGLPSGDSGRERQRAENRRALYAACRSADHDRAIYECDSPVGSGKTTAVMAHLLQAAQAKHLRRVFVVQPFTNIIDQSVKTYRKALLLPGEQADQVVVAHHHKTDFSDPLTRNLTTRWHAPVVVTTAVQFFETLASNETASLRKLHQLARSGIFIDEAHAALPAHLWPLAWQWLRQLAENWGCHIVLASGSLARFWELEDFYPSSDKAPTSRTTMKLSPLADNVLRGRLSSDEMQRVRYRKYPDELVLDKLIDFLSTLPGPCVAVFNTVQNAAVVARTLATRKGRDKVEHLSTALTAVDRATTLARIEARLGQVDDKDWILVATSLIEAGVDLSFRTGVREMSGLASVLQLGGRVNRHNEFVEAEVWSLRLRPGQGLNQNRAMQIAGRILFTLYDKKLVSPDSCTSALKREIRERDNETLVQALFQAENARQFPLVTERFKVIASETITAVTPGPFLDAIRSGARPDWKSLQSHCVQIWATRRLDFALTEIDGYPGLYSWNLDYDDFIGYMAGALEAQDVKSGLVQIV